MTDKKVPEEEITLLFINDERTETGEALEDAIKVAKQNMDLSGQVLEDRQDGFARARQYLDESLKSHKRAAVCLARLRALQSMLALMPDEEKS